MVVAFAGRRVDADGAAQRFPLRNAPAVGQRIEELLAERRATALVCSAACGADLLALEAAGHLGLRRRVILPFGRERFRETSVVDRPGDWGERFDRMADAVTSGGNLIVLGYNEEDPATYTATNLAILDQAFIVAHEAHQPVLAVVAWEGRSRGADDVTEHFLTEARRRGLPSAAVMTNDDKGRKPGDGPP